MIGEIEVCKTCNGTGIEYDGAGHICTACNGVAAPVVERQPAAYLVTDIFGQKKALRAGAEGIERHRKSGSTLVPLYAAQSELTALKAELASEEQDHAELRDVVAALREELASAVSRHASAEKTKSTLHQRLTAAEQLNARLEILVRQFQDVAYGGFLDDDHLLRMQRDIDAALEK